MIEYYWMAAIGICFILKYGSILEKFRTKTSEVLPILKKLYKCCLCMGFWVGTINAVCFFNLEFSWFVAGCISSGTSYLLSRIADDDGLTIKVKKQ